VDAPPSRAFAPSTSLPPTPPSTPMTSQRRRVRGTRTRRSWRGLFRDLDLGLGGEFRATSGLGGSVCLRRGIS
jgi:hypothetical protein